MGHVVKKRRMKVEDGVDRTSMGSHNNRVKAKPLPLTGRGSTRTGTYSAAKKNSKPRDVKSVLKEIQERPDSPRGKLKNNVATQEIEKGSLNGKILVAWDYVDDCEEETCPLGESCTWKTVNGIHIGKCGLRKQYLRALQKNVFWKLSNTMTEMQIWQFGMHIIPLYQDLISLKIVRASMRPADLFVSTKGGPKLHPIVAAIQQTIRAIVTAFKEAEIPVSKVSKVLRPKQLAVDDEFEGDTMMISGDPNYYNSLLEEEENQYAAQP